MEEIKKVIKDKIDIDNISKQMFKEDLKKFLNDIDLESTIKLLFEIKTYFFFKENEILQMLKKMQGNYEDGGDEWLLLEMIIKVFSTLEK